MLLRLLNVFHLFSARECQSVTCLIIIVHQFYLTFDKTLCGLFMVLCKRLHGEERKKEIVCFCLSIPADFTLLINKYLK